MEKETPSRKIYIFWKKYLENSNIDRKNKSSYTLIGTEYVCRGKQAERKVLPSTLEPDLDNANVGKERYLWEIPNEVFPFFICKKIDIHHGSSFQVFA